MFDKYCISPRNGNDVYYIQRNFHVKGLSLKTYNKRKCLKIPKTKVSVGNDLNGKLVIIVHVYNI